MKSIKFLTSLLMLIAVFIISATSIAQRRSGRNAPASSTGQSSGDQEAARFWSKYIASCGGSRYARKAPGIFVELRGFHVQMRYDTITEADRLNGVEAKGQSWFEASAYRIYSNSSWHAWGNGIPEDMQLTNSVRFQKARGRWNFYGVGYFNDYAKRLTCSDLPWVDTARKNETPTNSVMINDTHNFPIEEFIFWDAATNLAGDKFPQSTTTFVNWKIIYTGTAFDYSLPPVEGRWYKDGVPWSVPNVAQFSNVGKGQLWAGKGWEDPGHWEVGSYMVKVYLRGQLIAQRSFEIVSDEALPGEIRYGGLYYNKYDDGTYWVIRFFPDGTVRDLSVPAKDNLESFLSDAWRCTDNEMVGRTDYSYDYYCKDVDMGQGSFNRQGSQISFATYGSSKYHRIDGLVMSYEGIVTSSAVKLRRTDHRDNTTITNTFTFTRCPYRDC